MLWLILVLAWLLLSMAIIVLFLEGHILAWISDTVGHIKMPHCTTCCASVVQRKNYPAIKHGNDFKILEGHSLAWKWLEFFIVFNHVRGL